MRSKILNVKGERTIALVLDAGDEAMGEITRFAESNHIRAARFTAVGALSEAVIGWFDVDRRKYEEIPVRDQVEVLVMAGDIALDGGKPKVHAHIVLGRRDGSTCGGHLLSARVRPTLEVMLEESPAALVRRFDPRFGIALIDLDAPVTGE